MTIRKICELLEARVITGEDKLDNEMDTAFSSDMMSDVLAYVTGRTVLLTGTVNEHVIRTAEMVDVECVVFVRAKLPSQEVIDRAVEDGIVLLSTPHTLYVTSGILYSNGLPGIGRRKYQDASD